MEGQEENEDLVGHSLHVAVHRVEGEGRKRGRVDETVMRLVYILVDTRVVQPPMNEVDKKIRERQKQKRGNGKVEIAVLRGVVVHLPVAELHGDLGGRGHGGHDGEREHGHADLARDVGRGPAHGGLALREQAEVEEVVDGAEEKVDEERADVEEEPGHQEAARERERVAREYGLQVVRDDVDDVVRVEIRETCDDAQRFHGEGCGGLPGPAWRDRVRGMGGEWSVVWVGGEMRMR